MPGFQEIHHDVLAEIDSKGVSAGVDCYRRNREAYTALPNEKAVSYWQEILDAVQRKGNFIGPMSILKKNDPYLHRDPGTLTDDNVRKARHYRQNHPLDASLVDFILETTVKMVDLSERTDWVRVIDLSTLRRMKITSDSPLPRGYVRVDDSALN